MADLHIALEEGYEGETVVVTVDGDEVFRDDDVRTRYQIGLADSVDVTVASGACEVVVALPDRGLERTYTVDMSGDRWMGLSLGEDGQLHERISGEMFGYA